MQTISRLLDYVEKAINRLMIALLMLMTVVIFYQVVLRYIFQGANIWAEEFARYAFIWIVMLGSASALRRFKHIHIDFLVRAFPERVQKHINLVNYLLMLVFLVVLMIYGLQIAEQASGRLSAGLGVSMGFMYMSIPVGSVLMFLFTLEILFRDYFLAGTKNAGGGGKS